MSTSWVQGTTRRLLASVTIVDYAGAVRELFTPSIPSFLIPLCPVLDTYVEPDEDVVSMTIYGDFYAHQCPVPERLSHRRPWLGAQSPLWTPWCERI